MKPLLLIVVIMIIIGGYFFYEDGHIRANNERVGIFFLRGGYRAWWIRYSNGLFMTHPPKNLWCLPKFEHCDVRNLTNPKGG